MHIMWQFKHKIVLLFILLTSLSTLKADGVDLHKLGHIRHLMGAWGPQHLLTETQREGFLVWGKLQVANRKLSFLAVNSVPSLVIIGFDTDNFFSIGHSQWNEAAWKSLGSNIREPFATWVNSSMTTKAVVNLCMKIQIPGRSNESMQCQEVTEEQMRQLLASGELTLSEAHIQDNFYLQPTYNFYQSNHNWRFQPSPQDADYLGISVTEKLNVLPRKDQSIKSFVDWLRNSELKPYTVFLQSMKRLSLQPITQLKDNLWTNGHELLQINEDGKKWKLYLSSGGILESQVNRDMHHLLKFNDAIQWQWNDELLIRGQTSLGELPIGKMQYREAPQNSSLTSIDMEYRWGPIHWREIYSEQKLDPESQSLKMETEMLFPEGWQRTSLLLDHSAYKLEGKALGKMLDSQISISLTMPIPNSPYSPAPYHLKLQPSDTLMSEVRQAAFQAMREELQKDHTADQKQKKRLVNNPDFGTRMEPGMHTDEHALTHDQRLELLDLQILQEELTIEHAKVLQALESQAKLREKWLAKKKQTQAELEKMQSMLAKEWVDLPEYQNMWTDLKASMKKVDTSQDQQIKQSGVVQTQAVPQITNTSSSSTKLNALRIKNDQEGMNELMEAMRDSDKLELALTKRIQQHETFLETLSLRHDRLETRRQQIEARQKRFSRLHTRRGDSLKVWKEYLDAAKKVMAENDPKRFLRENPDPGETEKCDKSSCKKSIKKCNGRPRKCRTICIEWNQKCVTIEHPERGNWRLDLKARREAYSMAAYHVTRYKQLIALNNQRSEHLNGSQSNMEIAHLKAELQEVKNDQALAQSKLNALNKELSQHILQQEQLDLQDFTFAEDLKSFRKKYNEIKRKYNAANEPITKLAKVLELNSLAIKQQARFLKRWKTANEQLNDLDNREAPLRLKRASLEDKLLQNFEENAALRSQANSDKQIARLQSVPRPPVKTSQRKISSVRRQTLQIIDSRMERVQTFIEQHEQDSGSSFIYFKLLHLQYSDDLQAKRSDYVECDAKIELFGQQFVMRTFPWDRSLKSLKDHIRQQIPFLLEQRQLEIYDLPDTRRLFENSLSLDSAEHPESKLKLKDGSN